MGSASSTSIPNLRKPKRFFFPNFHHRINIYKQSYWFWWSLIILYFKKLALGLWRPRSPWLHSKLAAWKRACALNDGIYLFVQYISLLLDWGSLGTGGGKVNVVIAGSEWQPRGLTFNQKVLPTKEADCCWWLDAYCRRLGVVDYWMSPFYSRAEKVMGSRIQGGRITPTALDSFSVVAQQLLCVL